MNVSIFHKPKFGITFLRNIIIILEMFCVGFFQLKMFKILNKDIGNMVKIKLFECFE